MTMQEKWLLASKGLLESEKKIVGNQYFSVIIEQPHFWVLTMYGVFFCFVFVFVFFFSNLSLIISQKCVVTPIFFLDSNRPLLRSAFSA